MILKCNYTIQEVKCVNSIFIITNGKLKHLKRKTLVSVLGKHILTNIKVDNVTIHTDEQIVDSNTLLDT